MAQPRAAVAAVGHPAKPAIAGTRFVPLLASLLVSACAGAAPSERAHDASADGAGGSTGDVAAWTLAAEPAFSVTESDAEPSYHLYNVTGGLVLADGGVVVANGGTRHLIFFDSLGRAQRRAGAYGRGPGEFDRMGPLFHAGEDVGAWDVNLRRASYFSSAGEYLRDVAPTVTGLVQARGFIPGAGSWTSRR